MVMEDKNNDDEEFSIDFSKITNFFKRKKSKVEEVKKLEGEAKEVKEEVESKIEGEKPSGEELKELRTDKDKIARVEKELQMEEQKAEEVDRQEGELRRDVREINEEIKEVKEDIEEREQKEGGEEISIDFTKIKNFFKGLTKSGEKEEMEEGRPETKAGEESEEEISFDFSKIKSFFKGFGRGEKEPSGEEEISIDWKAISEFFVKYKLVFLLLIPLFLSIFLRVQPAYLPITDNWAKNNVYNYFKDQIRTQINQQYPNLPGQNKDVLVEREFQKFLSEQKSMLDQQIEGTSAHFKTRLQNENGQTYLLAIDPYFWARHARNIIENAHPGDELRDGKPYDNHMYAPNGRGVPPDTFHAYLEAYAYKFFSFFNRDLDLLKVVFYVPVILAALAVIPAFFIARRIGGNFGGVIAAAIVAIHPAFLTRTAGGFADTDAYNVLFPLLVTWLFLEAFETKDRNRKILFSAIAGLFVGMYSFTWGGWWHILAFIFATLVIYLGYYTILHINELKKGLTNFVKQPGIKNTLFLLLCFMISSMVFVSIFTSFSTFKSFLLTGPMSFVKMKEVGITTVWPNVFTTVAEQNPASLNGVISQIGFGNWFLFLIGISGLVLSTIKKKDAKLWFIGSSIVWYALIILAKPQNLRIFIVLVAIPVIARLIIAVRESDREIDAKYAILLALWILSTIYASVKGIRFTLLLVPAFAVSFGITVGLMYKYLNTWISKELNIHKIITSVSLILLMCLLLIAPFKSAMATATNEIPSMNDAWWSSLEKIRLESEPDAIINSWWDFGHWFKYIGDRAVTFDGTSQNSPQAHWIGNTLLTDDEDKAIGILRMLDCGANNAFRELNKIITDTPKAIDVIYKIIVLDKVDARKILEDEGLSDREADSVLQYTHCEPPEDYFISSEDMVGKAGVWSHFGSWDFDRALMYNTLKKREYTNDKDKSAQFLQERFNLSLEEAENIYYEIQSISDSKEANNWIAEWPNYFGMQGCNKKDNKTLECGFLQGTKALVDLETMDVDISTQQGIMHPAALAYATEDGMVKKEFLNDTIGTVGMTLIPSGDGYTALLCHPKLVAGMFTRLFYMEGHGLKHFEKFSDQRGITGGRIIVWKVNWEGNATNIMDEFKEPEETKKEEIEETAIDESEAEVSSNLSSNKP
ncbi:hypothetical protein KY360_07365 [Candidatus Woesearchaeota archaeon]|nr:hypothetical protein [Candidatus Woesearchaeota archaeon]